MNASKEQERESNEAEKTVQELHEQVVRLTAQLTTGEYQIRIRDAQIEDLQKAAANPMFEDSDGLPMDVDEMAYRLSVSEKRVEEREQEIKKLKSEGFSLVEENEEIIKELKEMTNRANFAEKLLGNYAAEILQLKAKLYDYQNPHDD